MCHIFLGLLDTFKSINGLPCAGFVYTLLNMLVVWNLTNLESYVLIIDTLSYFCNGTKFKEFAQHIIIMNTISFFPTLNTITLLED